MQIAVSRNVFPSSSLPLHCFCHCFLFSISEWNKLCSTWNLPSQVTSHDFGVFYFFVYSLGQTLSDGNQVQAFPPWQGRSAMHFLASLLCKKCGLEKSCHGADWIVWDRVKVCPELIRPASVNDRVRAKDLAWEKLQGLSRWRSRVLSIICF